MLKIIADKSIPFLKDVLEPYAEVRYLPATSITNEAVREADAILIRTRTVCNEALLHDSKVKFIGTATIGFDHIDIRYCDEHQINWANAPGCNASSVCQYVLSAFIELAMDTKLDLHDHTLGIIGLGNVGTKVKQVAELLGLNVLVNDPPRERNEGKGFFIDLDTLLEQSDIISLHVPLYITGIDKTFHLINDGNLEKMKNGAILINTSRGEVVDSQALKASLKTRKISSSILDVWENEPFPDPELIELAFIATPHIAGYSLDGKANGTSMIVNALSEFFDLPLKSWRPSDIQQPDNQEIKIDKLSFSYPDQLASVIREVYDIRAEDKKFRQSPGDFESIRNNYPLRREYPAYKIIPGKADRKITDLLIKLGFQLNPLQ
ncbi:MAG: 4-phosphoerythronate dehydrogenase PdxB [Bacteroidales bacterium]|nr:4-phosphoerythronate dehydrogenase PdxB [Bacteroidales bacterium]